MNERIKQTIEKVGNKVMDFLYDFDNNDYELDGGCCEPENGIYEAPSISIRGRVTIFGHEVTVGVDTRGGGYIEVLFEDDEYENLEEAVNGYVKHTLDLRDLHASAVDHYGSNYMDEWQAHGFRDEADYNRWRYGRTG